MKQETLLRANEINQRMNLLNNIKMRLGNKDGFYHLTFGVSIQEFPSNFAPILNEKSLTDELTEITKKYCDEKLIELQEQLDKL